MADESMNILVTGGAGFIGSHVADAYLAAGHDVWVLDDLSSGRRENIPQGARFVEGDIAGPEVRDLFRDVGFDLVNHHAAQIDVRVSVEDPAFDARTNLLGLLNLTEAAVVTGVKRFVFVSSGGVVYGEPETRPTPETQAKDPHSPYGVTKLAGEYYLGYYRRVKGLEQISLRYANVFGPRQDPHGEAGVVAIFCRRLLDGEPLTIFGDGEQSRDYVFVEDVAAANLLVSELALDFDGIDSVAFNVGTGVATSVNRLAEELESVAGVTVDRDPQPARPGELRHSTLDASKIEGMGWTPAHDLRSGLRETYRFIRERDEARDAGVTR